VIKEVTPQIMGMIAKVSHLVVTETAITRQQLISVKISSNGIA